MAGIRDRNIDSNKNDGGYPGLTNRLSKNLIDNDPDGYAAHDGLLMFVFADGATQTKTFQNAIPGRLQILDVTVIKTGAAGGASDTIQVFKSDGTTAISDAISINIANKATARAAQIDANSSNNIVADGGTFKVTNTKASANNTACIVLVNVARSA